MLGFMAFCLECVLLTWLNTPSSLTTAFTGLRLADARQTANPPAVIPVQRFAMSFSAFPRQHSLEPPRVAHRKSNILLLMTGASHRDEHGQVEVWLIDHIDHTADQQLESSE
jgi:hypothetical protein